VRHAPTESLGLDVLDMYTEMGTLRDAFLSYHCWQQSPTGILLQGSIENQLLEMGLYGSIWDNSRFPQHTPNTAQIMHGYSMFVNLITSMRYTYPFLMHS